MESKENWKANKRVIDLEVDEEEEKISERSQETQADNYLKINFYSTNDKLNLKTLKTEKNINLNQDNIDINNRYLNSDISNEREQRLDFIYDKEDEEQKKDPQSTSQESNNWESCTPIKQNDQTNRIVPGIPLNQITIGEGSPEEGMNSPDRQTLYQNQTRRHLTDDDGQHNNNQHPFNNRVHNQQEDPGQPYQNNVLQKYKKMIIWGSIILALIIIAILIGVLLSLLLPKTDDKQINFIDPFASDPILGKFMSLNSVSEAAQINFPISQEQYMTAMKSPLLKTIPVKFELNEYCNYTANITFMVESDVLTNSSMNGKEITMNYDVTFLTSNIQKDQVTIIVQYDYLGDSGTNASQSYQQDYSADVQSQDDADYVSDVLEYFSNQTTSQNSTEVNDENDSETNDTEFQRQLNTSYKTATCKLNFYGKITECSFIANMDYNDQNLALKLLRMYIPSLNISDYQQKIRRLLEDESGNSGSHEQSGNIEPSGDNGISHQSLTEDQNDNGNMNTEQSDDSNHVLDLDNGKIADSSKSVSCTYVPTSNDNFQSNETAIQKINAQGQIKAKFISKVILSQEVVDDMISQTSNLTFINIKNPEETLKIITGYNSENLTEKFEQENEFDSRSLTGRYLADEGKPSFDEISQQLFKLNVLIVTLAGGFGFTCPTDNKCITGLYIQASPIPKFWPIQKDAPANLGKILRQYRYVKLAFQKNIELFQNLTTDIIDAIDTLIFDNFDALSEQLAKFYQPILDAEVAIEDYMDNILSKAIALTESLDISKSMNDVLNSYLVQRINQLLGQFYSQIDMISFGFEDIINDYKDDVISSGLKFSNVTVANLQTQKNEVLGIFDEILDEFEDGWDNYMTNSIDIFSQTSSKMKTIKQSSSFSSMIDNYVNLVFDIVLQTFLSASGPLGDSFNNLKDPLKVQLHLYHASQRQSIAARFDEIIRYVNETDIGDDQIPQFDTTQLSNIIQMMEIDFDVLALSEDIFTDLIDEVQTRITRDIYKSIDLLTQIASCADEKALIANISALYNKEIDLIKNASSTNLTSFSTNAFNRFTKPFEKVVKDIKTLPANIKKSFDDTSALNNPVGAMDLNKEMNDIKIMTKDLKAIMDDLETLTDIDDLIVSEIKKIQNGFKNVLDAANRIEEKFNNMVTQIKALQDKLKISFTIPTNPFKFKKSDFSQILKTFENKIKEFAINQAKEKVKKVGTDYGKTFIDGLLTQLDSKVTSILQYSKKTIIYDKQKNKEIKLFEGVIPLPLGSAVVQIVKYFNAYFTIYFDMYSGNFAIVADAGAQFGYACRMAWDLYVVRMGVQIGATLFGGRAIAQAGLKLFSLTPSLFIYSGIFFEALYVQIAIVYQYRWFKFSKKCKGKRWYKFCWYVIKIYWTPWKMVSYQKYASGLVYNKVLLDKTIKLSLT